MSRLEKAIEFRELIKANLNATRKLVFASDLSQEELNELMDLYEDWVVGESVEVGDVRRYNGKLYKVIQAHTTQADWTPDSVPALWNEYTPPTTEDGEEIIPDFKQPSGGHDAYNIGDKVLFEGKVYERLIDNNAYNPNAYPAGWKLVN